RKAIEWLREDYDVLQGRFSPDGRYLAFLSNEADHEHMQVYARPFDVNKPDAPGPGPAVQISKNKEGVNGMIFWRQDGKELFFMTRDGDGWQGHITPTPTSGEGTPRFFSKRQAPLRENPIQGKTVPPDGQGFVFALPMR